MRRNPAVESNRHGQRNPVDASRISARNALVLGIFGATFATVLREISPDRSWIFVRQLYGIFLFGYCTWILWHEYTAFATLHGFKSPVLDTLLIAGVAVSLRSFILSGDLVEALWSLDAFLVCVCVWEIYTMKSGFRRYFMRSRAASNAQPWLRLMAIPLLPLKVPTWTHWNEYRYWLVLDLTALIVLSGMILVCSPYKGPELDRLPGAPLMLILTVIGLINIYRYNTVRRSSNRRGLRTGK